MRLKDVLVGIVKDEAEDYLSQFTDDYDGMFVTQSSNPIPSSFPCVEFQELSGIDRTNTLNREDVSAVLYTMQVKVYSEKDEATARSITEEICDQMKRLQFNMVSMPVPVQIDNLYCYNIRFRRLIAAGDYTKLATTQ
jgi:hypothetical protein